MVAVLVVCFFTYCSFPAVLWYCTHVDLQPRGADGQGGDDGSCPHSRDGTGWAPRAFPTQSCCQSMNHEALKGDALYSSGFRLCYKGSLAWEHCSAFLLTLGKTSTGASLSGLQRKAAFLLPQALHPSLCSVCCAWARTEP